MHITNNIKQIETSSKQSQKNDKKYSHKNLPPTKTSTSSTQPLSPSSLSIIIITFIITLTIISQSSVFAASSPSCYTPIPSKPGCSGLTSINDVKHKGQLKCFTIDKKAKDCGVFVNVLPTDTDQGLINSLGTLNCTGEDRNTPECADYCHNNPDTTPSECVRCDTLSEEQKIQYSYCSNEYCEAIIDYGNGSSWPTVPAGTVNVSGDCLEGYTGAPIRNCLEGGIWNGIISGACVPISGCDNALLNTNNEVPYAIFTITTGITEIDQEQEATTCETGYEMTGSVYAVCQSDGTWQYGNSDALVDVADSCVYVPMCSADSPIFSPNGVLMFEKASDLLNQCDGWCVYMRGYVEASEPSGYAGFLVDPSSNLNISVGWFGAINQYGDSIDCREDQNGNLYFEFYGIACSFNDLITSISESITVLDWSIGWMNDSYSYRTTPQKSLSIYDFYAHGTCSNKDSGGTIYAKCQSDREWSYSGNLCNP